MKRFDPEKVLEFFAKLKDCLLIVEGKKDAKSLNTLDLTNILAINGRPLTTVAEKVAEMRERASVWRYSDTIILTDFDKEGRKLAARLSVEIRARNILPNQQLMSRVMNFGFNKIEDIKLDSVLKKRNRRNKGSNHNQSQGLG